MQSWGYCFSAALASTAVPKSHCSRSSLANSAGMRKGWAPVLWMRRMSSLPGIVIRAQLSIAVPSGLLLRSHPQGGEAENFLIGKFDQIRTFLLVFAQVPLVEGGGGHDATLGAGPGTPPSGTLLQLFERRVNRGIVWRCALGEPRDQAPSHHEARPMTVVHPDYRHRLGRCDVVTRLERPQRLDDRELALDGCLVSSDETTAHGEDGGLTVKVVCIWAAVR